METRKKCGTRRMSIELDTDHFSFVEIFLSLGVFASRAELFHAAIDALAQVLEEHVREHAAAEGMSTAQNARLVEVSDALAAGADGKRMH